MKSVDAFESIAILKHKFEEIKNNILSIEKEKTRGFEEYEFNENKKRMIEMRADSNCKFRGVCEDKLIKDSENDTVLSLKKQIFELQEKNYYQGLTIENLKAENFQLKSKLESKVLNERNLNKTRPQSCLKTTSSSPKKNRVAFAKDLTKVKYIPNRIHHQSSDIIQENSSENDFMNSFSIKPDPVYETPPKTAPFNYSLKGSLYEKRAIMHKLSLSSFDNEFPDHFCEKSMTLAKQLVKD